MTDFKCPPQGPEERINYAELDPECVSLVRAMNTFPGITTFESCCGHGKTPFLVCFTAESLEVLPDLIYWFEGCHLGIYGWRVEVTTDCSRRPAAFLVESTEKGEAAYREAEQIAKAMKDD